MELAGGGGMGGKSSLYDVGGEQDRRIRKEFRFREGPRRRGKMGRVGRNLDIINGQGGITGNLDLRIGR